MPRLYVLPPSHYCERARWGLDHAGLGYEEIAWAAGPHATKARRLAPATTLPILQTEAGVLQGSGRILEWTGLGGGDPELEHRFETIIGPLVRQYLYAASLDLYPEAIRRMVFEGVTGPQAVLGRTLWPLTRRLLRKKVDARPELVPDLERALAAELAWFEARLAGRRYLTGETLGRADITAASLLSPLAGAEACPVYRHLRLPAAVARTVETWQRQGAVGWVLQTYGRDRR